MSDKQTDLCTCGHARAAHFEHKNQECSIGDCICAAFDKVDPLRAAAPGMLATLQNVYNYLIGLHAYLLSCETSVIVDNLESMSAFAYKQAELCETAIRKAKGE